MKRKKETEKGDWTANHLLKRSWSIPSTIFRGDTEINHFHSSFFASGEVVAVEEEAAAVEEEEEEGEVEDRWEVEVKSLLFLLVLLPMSLLIHWSVPYGIS